MRGPCSRSLGLFLAGLVGLSGALGGCIARSEPPPCVPSRTPAPIASGGPTGTVEAPDRLLQTLGDPSTSGLAHWPGPIDAAPKAFDIDGDGVDELIAHSNDTHVYVFSTINGRALALLPSCYPRGWYIERIINGVEAGTLRPGEPPSLVVSNHAAYVAAWRFVPHASNADRFVFEKLWERRMNECHADASMDAKATLADLDRDGTLEILVQAEEMGLYALDADGSTRWRQCWAGGNSAPVADDLDGNLMPEAIFASDSGFLSVLDGSTGDPVWTFDAAGPLYGISPASVSVSPAIAELDGRPPREILFTTRHAPNGDPANYSQFHMGLFAVHRNVTTWQGELVWMRQPEWANPLSYSRLVVADVDVDGVPEIFGMDWNTIGHKPGNWDVLGPSHVFRLDAHGNDVWVREVDAWWSNKDVLVADFDNDGSPELLVNGANGGSDGLWRLSTTTGQPEEFVAVAPWKLMRGPTLLNLRHDGSTQVAYPVAPDVAWPSRGAILVFDLGPSGTGGSSP